MKPTTGNNWAHITCALFLPRLKFVDAATLSPIEYVGAVAPYEPREVSSEEDGEERITYQCFMCSRRVRYVIVVATAHASPVAIKTAVQNCMPNAPWRMDIEQASKSTRCPLPKLMNLSS
jgi:hypothetical protein